MNYQIIKHNRNSSRTLGIYPTLAVALQSLPPAATYRERSYIGGFPIFTAKSHTYSIQGRHRQFDIVCSIPPAELSAHNLN